MADLNFLSQLVDSMNDAVIKLEQAKNSSNKSDFEKIKNFILDLQKRIDSAIEGK